MAVVPIWRLSGNAGLGQRGIFRPFVCVGVRRYGREMPGYRSVAIPDHFVARLHVGMVAIRQAATAWLFATIICRRPCGNGRDSSACDSVAFSTKCLA